MTDGHPRPALLRASLHRATAQDAELQAFARAVKADGGHQGFELLRFIADVASPNVVHTTYCGRSNATHSLRNAEAGKKPFEYADEHPLRAAALCAAQFQISRKPEPSSIEEYLLKALIAAGTRPAGCRRGGQLGLISFISESAKFNGADFDGTFVTHQGWGIFPGASAQRLNQALNDVRSSPPSLQLLAYDIGAWPTRMLGTQAAICLGWVASYLVSSATQDPMGPEISPIEPPSFPDSCPRDGPNMKRRREATGRLNPEELN